MEEELIYDAHPTKKQSMLSFYLSGAIAGVVSIAVSHPADTVKVSLPAIILPFTNKRYL
jgi:hypothetical protein